MSESIRFEDEVRRLIHAQPFAPFALVMDKGERYVVDDRGFFYFTENAVFLAQQKTGLKIFRKSHVVGVEVGQTAA